MTRLPFLLANATRYNAPTIRSARWATRGIPMNKLAVQVFGEGNVGTMIEIRMGREQMLRNRRFEASDA